MSTELAGPSTKDHQLSTAAYDHETSARVQVVQARYAACQEIAENFRQNKEDWQKRVALDIEIINRMVRSGLRLNECAGQNHEQLTFNDAGLIFFNRYLKPLLPEDMPLKFAQSCVHLARVIPEGVKTATEARQYMNHVQLCFGEELNKRGPEQLHPPKNELSEIVDRFKSLEAELRAAQEKRPLDKWERTALETAMRAARPTVEFYEHASKALLGKR